MSRSECERRGEGSWAAVRSGRALRVLSPDEGDSDGKDAVEAVGFGDDQTPFFACGVLQSHSLKRTGLEQLPFNA